MAFPARTGSQRPTEALPHHIVPLCEGLLPVALGLRIIAWKPTFCARPNSVTLDRHRAQERTFGFAPIAATQPNRAAS